MRRIRERRLARLAAQIAAADEAAWWRYAGLRARLKLAAGMQQTPVRSDIGPAPATMPHPGGEAAGNERGSNG